MLQNTGLKFLPDNFADLDKLRFLDLSINSFTEIPEPLFEMDSLVMVELSRNNIRLETAVEWANLELLLNSLPNLQELRLGWNIIGDIPEIFKTGPLSNRVMLEEEEYGEY
jgi:Leucine-rich repeat (LRR) protein